MAPGTNGASETTGRSRRCQPVDAVRDSRDTPATAPTARVTIPHLQAMKARGEPIAMVTAYDFPSGRLADEAGIDVILVGDSLAMTMLGHENTLAVTIDEMLVFARAVARARSRALVVGDMPFGSYAAGDDAVRNALRMMKEAGV